MCDGWSPEIGTAYYGRVVRQEKTSQPTTWLASVNASYLGDYFDRVATLARASKRRSRII